MWEQEKFSWDSPFMKFPEFPSYEGDTRSITPKPYQDPHPPAWMAAVSPDSVELAGRLGLGMLSLTIMQPVDELAKRIAIYREASANCTDPITRVEEQQGGAVHARALRREHGRGGVVRRVGLGRLVVRPHGAVHHRLGAAAEHARRKRSRRLFPRLRDAQAGKVDPKFFNDQDMVIIGEPDECLEKLARYQAIGCDSVICYMQFGQLKHNEIMESIETLGKHVIPTLEQRAE